MEKWYASFWPRRQQTSIFSPAATEDARETAVHKMIVARRFHLILLVLVVLFAVSIQAKPASSGEKDNVKSSKSESKSQIKTEWDTSPSEKKTKSKHDEADAAAVDEKTKKSVKSPDLQNEIGDKFLNSEKKSSKSKKNSENDSMEKSDEKHKSEAGQVGRDKSTDKEANVKSRPEEKESKKSHSSESSEQVQSEVAGYSLEPETDAGAAGWDEATIFGTSDKHDAAKDSKGSRKSEDPEPLPRPAGQQADDRSDRKPRPGAPDTTTREPSVNGAGARAVTRCLVGSLLMVCTVLVL